MLLRMAEVEIGGTHKIGASPNRRKNCVLLGLDRLGAKASSIELFRRTDSAIHVPLSKHVSGDARFQLL